MSRDDHHFAVYTAMLKLQNAPPPIHVLCHMVAAWPATALAYLVGVGLIDSVEVRAQVELARAHLRQLSPS